MKSIEIQQLIEWLQANHSNHRYVSELAIHCLFAENGVELYPENEEENK